MENDYEGISTKLLPKLVVTHVANKKGSSASEGNKKIKSYHNFIVDTIFT